MSTQLPFFVQNDNALIMTWLKCRRFSIFLKDIFTNMHRLKFHTWPCLTLSILGFVSRINFQALYCQFTVICNSYTPLKVFVLLRCFFAPNKTSGRRVLSQKRERRVKSHKGRFCIFKFYSELTSMFACFSFRSWLTRLLSLELTIWSCTRWRKLIH